MKGLSTSHGVPYFSKKWTFIEGPGSQYSALKVCARDRLLFQELHWLNKCYRGTVWSCFFWTELLESCCDRIVCHNHNQFFTVSYWENMLTRFYDSGQTRYKQRQTHARENRYRFVHFLQPFLQQHGKVNCRGLSLKRRLAHPFMLSPELVRIAPTELLRGSQHKAYQLPAFLKCGTLFAVFTAHRALVLAH